MAETDVLAAAGAAIAGDEAAFTTIVAAYHADLVRVSYLIAADPDLAHEAAQLAWSIAWRKLHTVRDLTRLRPWLVRVAANEARRLARRRRREAGREATIDLAAELPHAADREWALHAERLDLLNALQALKPEDRAIVAMRYGLGMSSPEIASAMGLSAVGVRSRLSRALDRLRKELTDG